MLIPRNSFSACGRNNNAFGWRRFTTYLLRELDSGLAFSTSMEIDHEDNHFSSASPVRVERRGFIRVRLRRQDVLRPAGEVVAVAERTRPKPAAGDPFSPAADQRQTHDR